MKRKSIQRWSTIPPISTKWTITSHLNSLNTKKKTMTFGIWNPGPVLKQEQKCGRANLYLLDDIYDIPELMILIMISLNFLDRGLLLTRKLLNQGYLVVKSSFRRFTVGNMTWSNCLSISMSKITTDMFQLWQSQTHPFLIHDLLPDFWQE